MYLSLLSALLLGLFPAADSVSTDIAMLEQVQIAPSSESIEISGSLSASGVVVYDALSGQRLFAKQARIQRPMASLTKLMTALIIVENHQLDEIVTVPRGVVDVTGNKAYLPPGKHFTIGDLLSALLINSANDAAMTLAQFHSGSVSAFVDEMNERALRLGMTGTSFRNPAGLDHPAHWSTPQDIAWLTMFSMRYKEISSRLGSSGRRIASREGDSIQLYHTHALLHEVGPVMAGKTGTTTGAGQCLMSVVEGAAQDYIVVLFNSNQRYKDMQTILSSLETGPEPVASQ
jgi:D-alanyl-D-alanine carboxypeptidase|tara:strand:+ start:4297 stop:5163 length:867 start_codon:yes stop_codon:yes gene_type:complete